LVHGDGQVSEGGGQSEHNPKKPKFSPEGLLRSVLPARLAEPDKLAALLTSSNRIGASAGRSQTRYERGFLFENAKACYLDIVK